MYAAEKAVTQMLEFMRESAPLLKAEKDGGQQKEYFALYYLRLLELVDGALRLAGQSRDRAPVSVLLRSALECSVDLHNLAENPNYSAIIRAMMLENRSAVFHFRTQPAYSELVATYGQERVDRLSQEAQNSFRTALKVATLHFPEIRNSARNLSVLMRFRTAGMEQRYQTEYTYLSMVTHNDMTIMAVEEELEALDLNRAGDEYAYNMCIRFLVDALRDKTRVFGRDDELVQACLGCLDKLRQKQQRKQTDRRPDAGQAV